MPFDFSYEVKDQYSGNDFGHNSDSDGNTVTGEYRVLLPDGRTQIVTYTADHYNGYQAEVRYEGEAQPYNPPPKYEQPKSYQPPAPKYEQPEPAYSAPAPTYEQPKPTYGQPSY